MASQTLLNELVRLQRVYEGREEELGLQSEELRGQLDKILTLNVAKDAVYAQEKQAMLVRVDLQL